LLVILAVLQWAWFLKAVPQLHGNDFGIFYRSVTSAHPYQPDPDNPSMESGQLLTNLNPPHFHLIIVPFTWLPFLPACVVWWVLNGVLLGAALTSWLRHQGHGWSAQSVIWALVWAPIVTMGFTGQVTAVVGVPLWFAFRALRDDRPLRGGLLLGIALSVKPILWPLGLWLWMRRAWTALGGAIAGSALMAGVGVAVYGVAAYREWSAALREIGWGAQVMNASMAAIGVRLPFPSPPVLWLALGTLLAVVTAWATRNRDVKEAWLPVVASSLLASPLGWVYYGAWLLPGTTLAHWTKWPGLGWCAPLIAVATVSNLGAPLWATIGSWYGLTLLTLWWTALTATSPHGVRATRPARA
jgi:hypothetical protein